MSRHGSSILGGVSVLQLCVYPQLMYILCSVCFFFQAEDGIRVLVRSRGLGNVYKRQVGERCTHRRYVPTVPH